VSRNTELYVATTHYHPEHTTGYVALPASALYVNSTVQEAEFADAGQQAIETFAGRTPVMADLLSDARGRVADILVSADGVLFSGDVVMTDSFLAANAGSSITAWLAAFDTFEAMRPTTIVPAHGLVGDGSSIQVLRRILEQICIRAAALKAQGRSADDAATAIQAELTAEHPTWPRANGLASLGRSAWHEAP